MLFARKSLTEDELVGLIDVVGGTVGGSVGFLEGPDVAQESSSTSTLQTSLAIPWQRWK